jgi:putative nucleotidyltransferase with HDIG domain
MPNSKNEKLIVLVEKMPAFPKSVQQVVQLTSDINSSAKDIVRVIECDPVMTLKILKAINSSFYGLPQKITSVQRAVVHIGLNTIKNMALGVAAMGMLNANNKANFNTSSFLLHSLTTAAISKILAERIGLPSSECSDCFVAGLLHDFGKVVFAEFMPDEFKLALEKSKEQQLSLHQTELEFIGLNHSQAGKMLAEKWQLSEPLINAIAQHHDLDSSQNILRDCVFAANQISKQLQFGDSGNPLIDVFPESIVTRFGLTLPDLCAVLGDLKHVKTEAQSFINL